MKMMLGTGTISNYGSYSRNCTEGQWPYKIPVNSISDVQLYIDIGTVKPDAVQYQIIHTCGALGGTIDILSTTDYVVGQDTNNRWYGVFKNFDPIDVSCFVVAITLTFGGVERIYFSDEYCVDTGCGPLTLLKGCYGNLSNLLSYDCEGIYFGTHAGTDPVLGDPTIIYKHQILLRSVEISLSAIKNTFKQGRTRNFRTEKEKIYQFFAEYVPEWYLPEVDAVFYRGEVYVGDTRYLLNETQFEKIDDCKRTWKPSATFKESCYQSFSCEIDPCAEPVPECCDPTAVVATVTVEPDITCCNPEVISAEIAS